MKKRMKIITVFICIEFLYAGLLLSVLTKDKPINYIENKILTQFPRISVNNIISGRFMEKFDSYATDQFPGRTNFLTLKNNFEFFIGKREFRDVFYTRTGRLLEKFTLNEDVLFNNIKNINALYETLKLNSTLILIPTSAEIYKEDLPIYAISDNQQPIFDKISNMISFNYFPALDILKEHKSEEIFFNTDHHWTQLGAKIVFEKIFNTKVNKPLTTIDTEFYGSYYSKAMLSVIKPDKIDAYDNTGNYKMELDFEKETNSLYDPQKLKTKNKYQYFLSGDPGRALIKGTGTGKVLILKDSFAHNFIPFLCEEFDEIHVIDPRYYEVDVEEYATRFEIDELIIIHNIDTLNDSLIY